MQARMCSIFKPFTQTVDAAYIPDGCTTALLFLSGSFVFTSYAQYRRNLSNFSNLFFFKFIPIKRVHLDSFFFVLEFVLVSCK